MPQQYVKPVVDNAEEATIEVILEAPYRHTGDPLYSFADIGETNSRPKVNNKDKRVAKTRDELRNIILKELEFSDYNGVTLEHIVEQYD